MSWAGIANNQTISFNNLKNAVDTSVLVAKTTIPTSDEQITKTDADTYVYINTSSPSYSAKASNQLVIKGDMTASATTTSTTTTTTTCASLPYSYTLTYDYDDGLPIIIGATTIYGACSAITQSFTVYSNSSTFSVGAALYYDSCGTVPIVANSYDGAFGTLYNWNSNYVTFETDSYTVRSVTSCFGTTTTSTTTTTTTLTPTTDYYTYNVTSTSTCSGTSCVSTTNEPVIACLTALTVGQYNLDSNTGKIFYISSYVGYGAYGGFIIIDGGHNATCDTLCSIF